MILSMFSAFGAGTNRNPVELQPVAGHSRKRHSDHGSGFEPGVNLRGNTLTSRFLFTAIKAEFYKKNITAFNRYWINGVNYWDLFSMKAFVAMARLGRLPFWD